MAGDEMVGDEGRERGDSSGEEPCDGSVPRFPIAPGDEVGDKHGCERNRSRHCRQRSDAEGESDGDPSECA